MESLIILDDFEDEITLHDDEGHLYIKSTSTIAGINLTDDGFTVTLCFDRKKVEQIRDYLNAFLESCKGDEDNGIH